MEQKGGRVRGKVLFNKGLCICAAHKDGGVDRQRGAAARKGLGVGSMKNHGIKQSKLDSVVKSSAGTSR